MLAKCLQVFNIGWVFYYVNNQNGRTLSLKAILEIN